MAIYSQCSDLETRQIMWVKRQTDDGPQNRFAGMVTPAESWWWAGCHADCYASDVIPPDLT